MTTSVLCGRGHLKTERPNGDLVCRVCHNTARNRRGDSKVSAGGLPQATVPSERLCIRGHKKALKANGETVCNPCNAAYRRGLRRLVAEGDCPHAGEPGFDGLLSLTCRLVCLTCLAEGALTHDCAA